MASLLPCAENNPPVPSVCQPALCTGPCEPAKPCPWPWWRRPVCRPGLQVSHPKVSSHLLLKFVQAILFGGHPVWDRLWKEILMFKWKPNVDVTHIIHHTTTAGPVCSDCTSPSSSGDQPPSSERPASRMPCLLGSRGRPGTWGVMEAANKLVLTCCRHWIPRDDRRHSWRRRYPRRPQSWSPSSPACCPLWSGGLPRTYRRCRTCTLG